LALANAGLGAVHGFAGPLGGMIEAPHGLICGKLLPFVTEANVRALRNRAPDSPRLGRFEEIARILTGKGKAKAADAVQWIHELCAAFGLPGLRQHGLREENLPAVVAKARRASSMRGNPVELSDEELLGILRSVID
jgi:alcohol dehydrogenase class IV